MAELLQTVHSPLAAGVLVALGVAFLLVRLGHAYLALRRDWDDYRVNRPRR